MHTVGTTHITQIVGFPRAWAPINIEDQKYNTQPAAITSFALTPNILHPVIFVLTVVF